MKTKKLLDKNTGLQNENVALKFELRALRNLCDDAYGLLMDHHVEDCMATENCEACKQVQNRMTANRLARIRNELNSERVRAARDDRQKQLGYDKLGPRQLDELGDGRTVKCRARLNFRTQQ